MKNLLLVILSFFLFAGLTQAQTVLYDWETPETSVAAGGSFGNGHFADSLFAVVDNPLPDATNGSAKVYQWCKANDAVTWGGIWFDVANPLDLTGDMTTLCLDVWMPHDGDFQLKLEQSPDGGPATAITMPYTGNGTWQNICWDFSQADPGGNVAAGFTFNRFTVFPDRGAVPAEDECHYFDNLTQTTPPPPPPPPLTGKVIADWEPDGVFLEAGGSFGNGDFADSTFSAIPNPDPSGINTSSTVWEWCKANNAVTWGGIYFDLPEPVALTEGNTTMCVDVWMPHNGQFQFKIEKSTDGGKDVSITQDYTGNGSWQQVCFDFTQPDGGGNIAAGYTYTRFTLFPDRGAVPAENECHYFDNVILVKAFEPPLTGMVIADWEPDGISYQAGGSFGNGNYADSTFSPIPNPDPSGINTSSTVYEWCKANDAVTWGGVYFDVDPAISLTNYMTTICVDVWMPHDGQFQFKIEKSTDGGPDVSITQDYTGNGSWQQLCYDFTQPDPSGKIAAGYTYTRFTLFPDRGAVPAENECHYFDNVVQVTVTPVFEGEMICDWDPDGVTLPTSSFPGGESTSVEPNPLMDEINPTDSVFMFCKDAGTVTWAGFYFAVIDTFDVTGDTASIFISVYADREITVRAKLEDATDGTDPVEMDRLYTTPGSWQILEYDFTQPGVNDHLAAGHSYTKLTIFPDYGVSPTEQTCSYVDNIGMLSNGSGAQPDLIGNVIAGSPDHTILATLLELTGLVEAVNQAGVTVFAPTDQAILSLPPAVLDALQNNTNNVLFDALLHHVAFDSLPADMLADGMRIIMRNGYDIEVSGGLVGGANVLAADIPNINGVLHSIDAVLATPEDPEQFVYIDFETPVTTPPFNFFGTENNIPSIFIVDNPNPTGINTSATVGMYKKFPDPSVSWQGIYADLVRPLNFYGNFTEVCMDIHADRMATVNFKVEQSSTGGANKTWTSTESEADQWSRICIDATSGANEDGISGENHVYNRLALFFDRLSGNPADTLVFYFDNVVANYIEVGTDDLAQLDNFRLQPNPVRTTLQMFSESQIVKADIYDVTGKLMMQVNDPVARRIDVQSLETGVYIVRLIGENSRYLGTARFIKL
jgi:uncharacterized surface protein with fasciclin (FAS1) repeats